MPMVRGAVAPVAEGVVRTLAAQVTGPPSQVPNIPTNLSGDSRSRGRDGIRRGERNVSDASRRAKQALLPPACRSCGVELGPAGRRSLSSECHAEDRRAHGETLKKAGPAALQRFRESGDSAKRKAARVKISMATATRNRERAAWDREHRIRDPEVFNNEILPMLARVPTSDIVAATGLSRNYAATIKAGKHIPHARHWDALREPVRVDDPPIRSDLSFGRRPPTRMTTPSRPIRTWPSWPAELTARPSPSTDEPDMCSLGWPSPDRARPSLCTWLWACRQGREAGRRFRRGRLPLPLDASPGGTRAVRLAESRPSSRRMHILDFVVPTSRASHLEMLVDASDLSSPCRRSGWNHWVNPRVPFVYGP